MFKLKYKLLFVNILTFFLILVIYFSPMDILRIILGLLVLLLFPGYTLLKALFPKKGDLYDVETFTLSFSLSILLIAFIGLILNFTPWGIQLDTVLLADTLSIVTASVIAWFRRQRSTREENSGLNDTNMAQEVPTSTIFKVLSAGVLVAILAGLGILGYIIGTTGTGEKFTQFYVLGTQSEPEGYPKELQLGEETLIKIVIINHEHNNMNYWMEVTINGTINNKTDMIPLVHEEKWERDIGFIPTSSGENQKVEFLLYKQGEDKPYQKLYLWIDVRSS